MDNKSIHIGECLGAFSPIIIFLAVRELVKLLAHNMVMSFMDNGTIVFGFDFGSLRGIEGVSIFLQSNSIYITGFCNLVCIIIYIIMLKNEPLTPSPRGHFSVTVLKTVFASLCLSMAVTGIIRLLGIDAASAGYQQVQAGYSGKNIAVLIIALGILAPLSEELCFRGLMYTRIKGILGQAPAFVFSSVCFGLIHGNAAQMIHAAALGILLAFFYEKGGSLIVPLAGHMAVNLFAIFTDASGGMENMYRNTFVAAGFIIVNITVVYMMLNSMRDKK
ncbi:MAG: CPBP family intramembrane metalloprotease [Lachnospiraceae bacterium]|nr:CPBP family intramembrane metalloprotease [Lachnospiraceae bacterium]